MNKDTGLKNLLNKKFIIPDSFKNVRKFKDLPPTVLRVKGRSKRKSQKKG